MAQGQKRLSFIRKQRRLPTIIEDEPYEVPPARTVARMAGMTLGKNQHCIVPPPDKRSVRVGGADHRDLGESSDFGAACAQLRDLSLTENQSAVSLEERLHTMSP